MNSKATMIFTGDAKKLLAGLQGSKSEVQAAKQQLTQSEFIFFLPSNYRTANCLDELLYFDERTNEQLSEIELTDRYQGNDLFFVVPASLYVKNKKSNE